MDRSYSVFFNVMRTQSESTISLLSLALLIHGRQFTQAHAQACSNLSKCVRIKLWRTKEAFFQYLSLIHISEPTRLLSISYAVFCLKKKKKKKKKKKTTI
eukprot:TRINITY_DN5747_c0_g1_i7.p2 TRINITY_DN5747_c0_g1~~TRINITY_DN5747_c0_g1_i7.p2  ORF type:complete len:100 (+),score=30.60 TRINITY_DN5747_c0_g1_i7:210-509(+)